MKRKKKKSVSLLVSYVLLVLLAVTLAGLIYGFLKSRAYVPEALQCPDGVSIYVVNFSCNANVLFWIKNNGLWNVSGINVKIYQTSEKNIIAPCLSFENQTDIGIWEEKQIQSRGLGDCYPEKIDRAEILPFIISKPKGSGPAISGKKIYCSNARIKLDVSC